MASQVMEAIKPIEKRKRRRRTPETGSPPKRDVRCSFSVFCFPFSHIPSRKVKEDKSNLAAAILGLGLELWPRPPMCRSFAVLSMAFFCYCSAGLKLEKLECLRAQGRETCICQNKFFSFFFLSRPSNRLVFPYHSITQSRCLVVSLSCCLPRCSSPSSTVNVRQSIPSATGSNFGPWWSGCCRHERRRPKYTVF